MLRVAVVDDHHAVRLGLQAAIRSEPGLAVTGVAADGAGVPAMLRTARPDVVLLDYRLPDTDGLSLCRAIKAQPPALGVILYSAFADAAMIVPAVVAGADAIVHKGGNTRGLLDTIRLVARGGKAMPAVPPGLLEATGALLDEQISRSSRCCSKAPSRRTSLKRSHSSRTSSTGGSTRCSSGCTYLCLSGRADARQGAASGAKRRSWFADAIHALMALAGRGRSTVGRSP